MTRLELINNWLDFFYNRCHSKYVPGEAAVLSNEAAIALQLMVEGKDD